MRTSLRLATCAVALLALVGCSGGGSGEDASSTPPSGAPSAQQSAPEADVSDVPDPVAEVNEGKIGKEEFILAYEGRFQQAVQQSQGQPVDQAKLRTEVAENMVSTELLTQEADKRDLKATDKEVNQALEAAAEQNGMSSTAEFLAALAEQGMTKEQVVADLKRQVKINHLVDDEAGTIKVTEKELKDLYEQAVAQQEQSGEQSPGTEPPSYEEMKPQLKEQIESQKKNEVAQKLVESLRSDADVTVHV